MQDRSAGTRKSLRRRRSRLPYEQECERGPPRGLVAPGLAHKSARSPLIRLLEKRFYRKCGFEG